MAITDVYSNDVRQRDYIVYVCPFSSDTATTVETETPGTFYTLLEYVNLIDDTAGNKIDNLITVNTTVESTSTAMFSKIGELRRDSIVTNLAEGNTVEGNEVGKIVIDKAGDFTFDVINVTQVLTDYLDTIDRSKVCLLKVYTKKDDDNKYTEAEFYPDYSFTYNENLTGGEVGSITVSVKKQVDSVDDYSIILPVPVPVPAP